MAFLVQAKTLRRTIPYFRSGKSKKEKRIPVEKRAVGYTYHRRPRITAVSFNFKTRAENPPAEDESRPFLGRKEERTPSAK